MSESKKNFIRSLKSLEESLKAPITEPRDLAGIIKNFEMTYELSWKSLKKILLEQGNQTLGSKDVFIKAYQLGYIDDEKVWLQMIEDRNLSAHVYDENDAKKIVERIRNSYLTILKKLSAHHEFTKS